MNVLLTKAFAETDISYLSEKSPESIKFVQPSSFDNQGILEKLQTADVLFGGLINEEILAAGKHLKLIQIPWTGIDNLPFDLLTNYSVPICNSHSNSSMVAEHAVAMLLALARKLPYHDRLMRQDKWNRISNTGNAVSPFSMGVANKRILYVGFGAIAKECSKLLTGFNLVETIVNTTGEPPASVDSSVATYRFTELSEAVHDQDIVMITLPLTSQSRRLIDHHIFSAMSKDAVLINVSRGAIVDEQALFEALSENKIAAAAVDTWYQNPSPSKPEVPPSAVFDFASLDNLLMSPHRAGYQLGGFPHLDDAIVNLTNLTKGMPLINVIDTIRRY